MRAAGDANGEYDERAVTIASPKKTAAGVPAVLVALRRGLAQMGVLRAAQTLRRVNRRGGFGRSGCAWPEQPGRRKAAEFCENGAKAVADMASHREYWLSQPGRLTHPMVEKV
jgi:hypothetical protein